MSCKMLIRSEVWEPKKKSQCPKCTKKLELESLETRDSYQDITVLTTLSREYFYIVGVVRQNCHWQPAIIQSFLLSHPSQLRCNLLEQRGDPTEFWQIFRGAFDYRTVKFNTLLQQIIIFPNSGNILMGPEWKFNLEGAILFNSQWRQTCDLLSVDMKLSLQAAAILCFFFWVKFEFYHMMIF